MQKVNITKILTIVSILVIVIGIILGIIVSNVPIDFSNNEKSLESTNKLDNGIYVDGTDVSGIVSASESLGSEILKTVIVFAIISGSFFIVIVIWIVYGIYILISKAMNKAKQKV